MDLTRRRAMKLEDRVYVVVPAVIAAMTGGLASAWLLLTRITA
jgi:hypothetical protein